MLVAYGGGTSFAFIIQRGNNDLGKDAVSFKLTFAFIWFTRTYTTMHSLCTLYVFSSNFSPAIILSFIKSIALKQRLSSPGGRILWTFQLSSFLLSPSFLHHVYQLIYQLKSKTSFFTHIAYIAIAFRVSLDPGVCMIHKRATSLEKKRCPFRTYLLVLQTHTMIHTRTRTCQ